MLNYTLNQARKWKEPGIPFLQHLSSEMRSGNGGLVSGNGEDGFRESHFCNTSEAKCIPGKQDWFPGMQKVVSWNPTCATPLKRNAFLECRSGFLESWIPGNHLQVLSWNPTFATPLKRNAFLESHPLWAFKIIKG